MDHGIKIRPARQRDIMAILELWKELMDFHAVLDPQFARSRDGHDDFARFLAENIKSEDACTLVADHAGELLGYCLAAIATYPPVFVQQRYGAIYDLAVTERFRRRGVGRALVEYCCAWFVEQDIHRVEAQFATVNPVSTAFWTQKLGFMPYLTKAYKELEEL